MIINQESYLQEYQQLLNKARNWSKNHKDNQYLLVDEDRRNAEKWLQFWLDGQDGLQEPQPLHYQFIEASYQQDFYDFFLVYEPADFNFALQVQSELIAQGFRVLGQHNYSQNGNYKNDIEEIIQRTDNLIYFVSNAQYKPLEISLGKRYNKRIIEIDLNESNNSEFNGGRRGNKAPKSLTKIVEKLSTTIRENKEDLRYHSYLLVKALEWELVEPLENINHENLIDFTDWTYAITLPAGLCQTSGLLRSAFGNANNHCS